MQCRQLFFRTTISKIRTKSGPLFFQNPDQIRTKMSKNPDQNLKIRTKSGPQNFQIAKLVIFSLIWFVEILVHKFCYNGALKLQNSNTMINHGLCLSSNRTWGPPPWNFVHSKYSSESVASHVKGLNLRKWLYCSDVESESESGIERFWLNRNRLNFFRWNRSR